MYTASWVAPKADVHSQQGFHYMGYKGEARVDQAHRGAIPWTDETFEIFLIGFVGYYLDTDENGHQSVNPLYMKYTPDTAGNQNSGSL